VAQDDGEVRGPHVGEVSGLRPVLRRDQCSTRLAW
jgi:hypothetical protein